MKIHLLNSMDTTLAIKYIPCVSGGHVIGFQNEII